MQGREPREIWFLFETEFVDLAEFNDELGEAGTVYGHRIESEQVAPGLRREISRFEFILGREWLLSVSTPRDELLPPGAQAGRS